MTRILKPALAAAALWTLAAPAAVAQEAFLGEIDVFGNSYCPKGWAPAAGQLLPIAQNQALFSLLGTSFGGDGRVNFALPDFRDRVSIGTGQAPGLSSYDEGQNGGVAATTLVESELPSHAHLVDDLGVPAEVRVKGGNGPLASVQTTAAGATIASGAAGGSQPHENRQPYLGLNVCIALVGIFPSRP